MKVILRVAIVCIIVIAEGCVSGKSAYKHGDYYDAVLSAVQRLRQNPENKKSKEVFIELHKLPKPETGKQYQLWAIVDGKPVDAGMITMTEGDTSLHRMKDFESAQAFAITLEKEGGVPSPTLSELYVLGSIGS